MLVFRTVKAQKIFTADFTQQTNKISTVRNFWDIRNIVSDRLDKDLEQGEIINSVRLLRGWKTDTSGEVDAYKWNGANYVYDFDVLLARIDKIIENNELYQIVLDNVPWAFKRGITFVDEPNGINYLSKEILKTMLQEDVYQNTSVGSVENISNFVDALFTKINK